MPAQAPNKTHSGSLPKTGANARIGILGGSFDPPHIGHQLLALGALAMVQIDEVWVLPCADHPQKKNHVAFKHRYAMCQLAFARIANCRVLDLEAHLPPPSYTVNTLKAIKQQKPDIELTLLLGSDLIASIESWHTPEKLAELAHIAFFAREGHGPLMKLPPLLKGAQLFADFAFPDIQSRLLRDGTHPHSGYLDHVVREYMAANGLYVTNADRKA
jgi:nicotinate-nucleotide adenylyltransferase